MRDKKVFVNMANSMNHVISKEVENCIFRHNRIFKHTCMYKQHNIGREMGL